MRLYPLLLVVAGTFAILFAWPYLPFLAFMGVGAFGAGLVLFGIRPGSSGSVQRRAAAKDRASNAG